MASCGAGKAGVNSASARPPIERVTPAARPTIPDPAVACPGDPAALCFSDAQTAQVIADQDTAISKLTDQVCWLRVWFGYPACPAVESGAP